MFRYFRSNDWSECNMKENTFVYDLDLELCTEIQEIDDYFIEKEIVGFESRTNFLFEYMGATGFENFGEITPEQQYEIAKELFVSGKWKLINGR